MVTETLQYYLFKLFKKISEKFGTGENASEQDIIDFILFALMHRSFQKDDIIKKLVKG